MVCRGKTFLMPQAVCYVKINCFLCCVINITQKKEKIREPKRNGDILSKIAVSFWLRAVIMIKMR